MKNVKVILIAVVIGILVGSAWADEELESVLTGPVWGLDRETVQHTPEPGTMALLGIAGLALLRRRRRT